MRRLALMLALLTAGWSGLAQDLSDPLWVASLKTSGGGGSPPAWSPSDEASLVGWYNETGHTNTAGSLAADKDALKAWRDNSGHNNHFTNWNANTTLTTNIDNAQNGLACVRFDGVNDYMRADDIYTSFISGNDTPMIWGMAYRLHYYFKAHIWFDGIKSGGTPARQRAEVDGSNRYFTTRYDGTVNIDRYVDWPLDTNGWHVAVLAMRGTTVQWYHDGLSLGDPQDLNVGTLDNNASDIFYVGRDVSDSPYYGGDMGEVLIFNSASVNPTNIFTYLQGRWNTPVAVPDICTVTFYTNSVAQDDFSDVGSVGTYYGVYGWDPGQNVTICSFMFDTTLGAGVTYRASVWTLTGESNLDVQQGTWSYTQVGTGSRKNTKWVFASGMALNNGTVYALVISPVTGTLGGEYFYQGGDTASYSTGVWDAGKAKTGGTTRDPKFSVLTE